MSAGGVTSGANEAASAMDKMGEHAKRAAKNLNTIKNVAVGAAIAEGISVATNAISVATNTMARAGNAALAYAANVAQSADETAKLAQRLGMAVEPLQALQLAAQMAGVNDLTAVLQKMSITLGQATNGSAQAQQALAGIGLSVDQLASMAPDEQFRAISASIAAIQDPAQRAAAAVAIFGEQGVALLPLMSQNLAEVQERLERLGVVLSADQTEAIESMNDALTLVQATFDGIIGQVVGNLAPVVESLANEILSMVESFNSVSGSGGEGIANTITVAMLDIADYLAGVFDSAIIQFQEFGGLMETVGSVFQFVGNVFVAVSESIRAAFNVFELVANSLEIALGAVLEWFGVEMGKHLKEGGMAAAKKNAEEWADAAGNAGAAVVRAATGAASEEPQVEGPAASAFASARQRMTPEAKAEREAAREQRAAEQKAAKEAAAAEAKAKRDAEAAKKQGEKAAKEAEKAAEAKAKSDAEEAKKRQEKAAKQAEKAAGVQDKIDDKQDDIAKIETERAKELGGKSNEALQANDVRSSEGMAQFLALATGREDPAIAEYRKQTQKLEELKAELRALQQEKVEILGGANN